MKPIYKKLLKRTGLTLLLLGVVLLAEYAHNFPAYICIEPLTLLIIVGLIIGISILAYYHKGAE